VRVLKEIMMAPDKSIPKDLLHLVEVVGLHSHPVLVGSAHRLKQREMKI